MYIKVKVHAEAKENRLERLAPDRCEVWVKAPRKEGLANAAVLALLRKELGPGARMRLVKGATSPSKIVELF